ncbi:hypothetical protein Esti_002154 [Eimeria stiedai]
MPSLKENAKALAFLRGRRVLFQLEHPLLHVGRANSCDISLRYAGISRLHAAFDLTGLQKSNHGGEEATTLEEAQAGGSSSRKAFVKDLASLNGTWVNNLRLKPHVWHPLKHGDFLAFSSSDDNKETVAVVETKRNDSQLIFELPEVLQKIEQQPEGLGGSASSAAHCNGVCKERKVPRLLASSKRELLPSSCTTQLNQNASPGRVSTTAEEASHAPPFACNTLRESRRSGRCSHRDPAAVKVREDYNQVGAEPPPAHAAPRRRAAPGAAEDSCGEAEAAEALPSQSTRGRASADTTERARREDGLKDQQERLKQAAAPDRGIHLKASRGLRQFSRCCCKRCGCRGSLPCCAAAACAAAATAAAAAAPHDASGAARSMASNRDTGGQAAASPLPSKEKEGSFQMRWEGSETKLLCSQCQGALSSTSNHAFTSVSPAAALTQRPLQTIDPPLTAAAAASAAAAAGRGAAAAEGRRGGNGLFLSVGALVPPSFPSLNFPLRFSRPYEVPQPLPPLNQKPLGLQPSTSFPLQEKESRLLFTRDTAAFLPPLFFSASDAACKTTVNDTSAFAGCCSKACCSRGGCCCGSCCCIPATANQKSAELFEASIGGSTPPRCEGPGPPCALEPLQQQPAAEAAAAPSTSCSLPSWRLDCCFPASCSSSGHPNQNPSWCMHPRGPLAPCCSQTPLKGPLAAVLSKGPSSTELLSKERGALDPGPLCRATSCNWQAQAPPQHQNFRAFFAKPYSQAGGGSPWQQEEAQHNNKPDAAAQGEMQQQQQQPWRQPPARQEEPVGSPCSKEGREAEAHGGAATASNACNAWGGGPPPTSLVNRGRTSSSLSLSSATLRQIVQGVCTAEQQAQVLDGLKGREKGVCVRSPPEEASASVAAAAAAAAAAVWKALEAAAAPPSRIAENEGSAAWEGVAPPAGRERRQQTVLLPPRSRGDSLKRPSSNYFKPRGWQGGKEATANTSLLPREAGKKRAGSGGAPAPRGRGEKLPLQSRHKNHAEPSANAAAATALAAAELKSAAEALGAAAARLSSTFAKPSNPSPSSCSGTVNQGAAASAGPAAAQRGASSSRHVDAANPASAPSPWVRADSAVSREERQLLDCMAASFNAVASQQQRLMHACT